MVFIADAEGEASKPMILASFTLRSHKAVGYGYPTQISSGMPTASSQAVGCCDGLSQEQEDCCIIREALLGFQSADLVFRRLVSKMGELVHGIYSRRIYRALVLNSSSRNFFSKNSSLRLLTVTWCPPTTRRFIEIMSSSELSELSSGLSSEDENILGSTQGGALDNYLKKGVGRAIRISPPVKKQRPASPPHEYVLADNPDIAVSLAEPSGSLIYELLNFFDAGCLHVPVPFQRCIPQVTSPLWASGH